MKIRSGFVSNSSSSSFIVFNDCSIIPKEVNYVKLNKEYKIKLIEQGFIDSVKDDIYLTEFISDCCIGEDYDNFYKSNNKILYRYGSHIGPYDDSDFKEIGNNVWFFIGNNNDDSDKD